MLWRRGFLAQHVGGVNAQIFIGNFIVLRRRKKIFQVIFIDIFKAKKCQKNNPLQRLALNLHKTLFFVWMYAL